MDILDGLSADGKSSSISSKCAGSASAVGACSILPDPCDWLKQKIVIQNIADPYNCSHNTRIIRPYLCCRSFNIHADSVDSTCSNLGITLVNKDAPSLIVHLPEVLVGLTLLLVGWLPGVSFKAQLKVGWQPKYYIKYRPGYRDNCWYGLRNQR